MKFSPLRLYILLGVAATSAVAADPIGSSYHPTMPVPTKASDDLLTTVSYLLWNPESDGVAFADAYVPTVDEPDASKRIAATTERLKDARAILAGEKDLVLWLDLTFQQKAYNPTNHTLATNSIFPYKMQERTCVGPTGMVVCGSLRTFVDHWFNFGGLTIEPEKLDSFWAWTNQHSFLVAAKCRVSSKSVSGGQPIYGGRSIRVGTLIVSIREFTFIGDYGAAMPQEIASAIRVGPYVRTEAENAILARFQRQGLSNDSRTVIFNETNFACNGRVNNTPPRAGLLDYLTKATRYSPWVAFDDKLVACIGGGAVTLHSYKLVPDGMLIDNVLYRPNAAVQMPAGAVSW